MSMETTYIKPRFYLVNSYEELMKHKRESSGYLFSPRDGKDRYIEFDDILKHHIIFIVAEPGHGKTRLIKELRAAHKEISFLAEFRTKPAQTSLSEWLVSKGVTEATDIMFMDGLDEMPSQHIIPTLHSLVDYIKTHPNAKFIISCRIHYFSKYQTIFNELATAQYLLIHPLEKHASQNFLNNLGVDEATINTLFKSLPYRSSQSGSILQNPRYLEMIAKKVKEPGFDTKNLNRSTLFSSFIQGELLIEDSKSGRQLADFKQRLLECLALTMEIAQLNEISSDDFITFIERINSDIKFFMSSVEIENIYEHSLLTRDINGTICFANVEIQEYLAAKYITRLANPVRKTYMLAFDSTLREIIPSWRNTVSFILDEIPEIAHKIIDLHPNRLLLDESTEQLVTGITSTKITLEDRHYIFDYVWQSNNRRANFIGRNTSFNLARYAAPDQIDSVVSQLRQMRNSKKNHTQLLNHIVICGHALQLNRVDDESRSKVIARLLRLAKQSKDSTIVYNAVHSLANTKDIAIVKKLFSVANSRDNLVFEAVQDFAYGTDQRSNDAINLYILGMKRGDLYLSRQGINSLDTVDSISYFLSKLANDKDLIESIISRDRIYTEERSEIINNINRLWQDSWLHYLKEFIILSFQIEYGYYAERSKFVDDVITTIAAKDSSYFTELFTRSMQFDEQGHIHLFRTANALARIMPTNEVDMIVNIIRQDDNNAWLLWRLIEYVLYSDNPNKRAIEQQSRTLLPDFFEKYDKQVAKQRAEAKANSLTVKFNTAYANIPKEIEVGSLQSLLEAAKLITDCLQDSNPRDSIAYSDEQVEYIWETLKQKILDQVDTSNIDFHITKKESTGISYTISSFVPWFELAIKFGKLTKQEDLSLYKKNILHALPHMYEYETNDLLNDIELDANDIQEMLDLYSDLEKDETQHLPNNFINLVNTKKIDKAVPILHKLVMHPNFPTYVKMEAIRTVEALCPNKDFLIKVAGRFDQPSAPSEDKEIAELARSLLISKHAHEDSINRRFRLLETSAFDCPVHPPGVMHTVSDKESELHDKTLAKPLMSLDNKEYLPRFLDLLESSFAINARGSGWSRYAYYLWEICLGYFNNLSSTGDLEILKEIETAISSQPPSSTAGFLRHFTVLRDYFLEQNGPKSTYISAVHMVNDINTVDDRVIASNEELLMEVRDLVGELGSWIDQEGSDLTSQGEDLAQKNIALRLHNLLLRKYGKSNIRVERETQAYDGTRTDFYVYYGFLGPIIIELKLSTHKDLSMSGNQKTKKSYSSMEKYMKQFEAPYGMLLVYRHSSTDIDNFNKIIHNTKKYYGNIDCVEVISIQ